MCYSPINIKRIENFVKFDPAIFFTDFSSSQSEKFFEIDTTRIIFIKLSQNLIDKLILSGEAQIQEGLFQLGRIDWST